MFAYYVFRFIYRFDHEWSLALHSLEAVFLSGDETQSRSPPLARGASLTRPMARLAGHDAKPLLRLRCGGNRREAAVDAAAAEALAGAGVACRRTYGSDQLVRTSIAARAEALELPGLAGEVQRWLWE